MADVESFICSFLLVVVSLVCEGFKLAADIHFRYWLHPRVNQYVLH